MQKKSKRKEIKFGWLGFFALLIGIALPIYFLGSLAFSGLLLQFLISTCLLVLLVCIRYYNWKNIAVALMVLGTLYPVRFIFHWWINPIFYGLISILYLLWFIQIAKQYSWKHTIALLMLLCTLLAGLQLTKSSLELGNCYIDDIRWTQYFYCESTKTGYQQIENLPIGMQGYCYYCPWYYGVSR